MSKKLVWSQRSLNEFSQLQDYLLNEWGISITLKVRRELEERIAHILNYPEHYPILVKSKKIRRCVFSPQTSIFYKVNNDTIFILSIFDNRQHPKKKLL